MRSLLPAFLLATIAAPLAAQGGTVRGAVTHRDLGQPLGYTTVVIPGLGRQQLTDENGGFVLRHLPPGELRLVFKRIAFVPWDTTIVVTAGATAELRVRMSRLALRLPSLVVEGRCTDTSPREEESEVMRQLFDQVNQNAARVRLMAEARPFVIDVMRTRGQRFPGGGFLPSGIEPVTRSPMPEHRYAPKQVIRRGTGKEANEWHVLVPELPDFADTTFTNNHCFHYAGQTRFFGDSVIRVDYEPVPWLARETDIVGSMYLTVDGYRLVGTVTKLNRIPGQFRRSGLREFVVTARFAELVPGIPVLFHWELVNRFRPRDPERIETGEVTGIRWRDSTLAQPDSVR